MENKPVVKIKNARVFQNRLIGVAIDHPREDLNGTEVRTSDIINYEGNKIETRNTIYMVESWMSLPQRMSEVGL